MNERIRELAEQAAWRTRMAHNNAYWRMQDKMAEDATWREKFAELIVRECVSVMKSTVDESIDFDRKLDETSSWIERDIKKHFGVGE